MTVHFDTSRAEAIKRASSPLYKGYLWLGEGLTLTFHRKRCITRDQCHAVGFAILELAKLHMQRLWYDHIIKNVAGNSPSKVSMITSDTDSFLFAARDCGNEDDIIGKLRHEVMDTSNYPASHPLFNASRAKMTGFLKNELPTKVIEQAVALRSKAYALKVRDPIKEDGLFLDETKLSHPTELGLEEVIKCKGVASGAKRSLTFNAYKRCLAVIGRQEVQQFQIRSKDHRNQLISALKVCFSSFDDKRYLFCPIHSHPYGSTYIEFNNALNKGNPGDPPCPFCSGIFTRTIV